jgi:hypothetical protein
MSPVLERRRSGVLPEDQEVTVVLVRRAAEVASWSLTAPRTPTLAMVDELARLQLAASRLGCSVRLRGACRELQELLDLVGLTELLVGAADLGVEAGRQPEGGEEVGVEEVVVPDDPVA